MKLAVATRCQGVYTGLPCPCCLFHKVKMIIIGHLKMVPVKVRRLLASRAGRRSLFMQASERNAEDDLKLVGVATVMARLGRSVYHTLRARPELAILAIIVAIGGFVRLHNLSDATMGHVEIYIPGIPLPYEVSDPRPRHTVMRTVVSTIHNEPHPPGYYLFMLAWTKLFGASLFSLRLPSVFFGLGSIVLIYWLTARVGLMEAGLCAAAFWATHPLAVVIERTGRAYALLCFLGLLSSALLAVTYNHRYRRLAMLSYIVVILMGVGVSLFFWPILFAQLLFTLLGPRECPTQLAMQTRWQTWAIALSSPFLAIAAYAANRPSYLGADLGSQILQYLEFLFVWSPYEPGQSHCPAPNWTFLVLAVVVSCFFILGIIHIARRGRLKSKMLSENRSELWVERGGIAGPSRTLVCAAAGLAVIAIIGFAWFSQHYQPYSKVPTASMLGCAIIPLAIVSLDEIARRFPRLLRRFLSSSLRPVWLMAILGTVPVATIALVSLAVPLFAERTVSAYGPYTLVLVAAGILVLSPHWGWRIPVLGSLLAVNVTGLMHERLPPVDHAGLARQVTAKTEPDDLWFVYRHWALTPIFYYLSGDDHRLVGGEYARALENNPHARVWLLRVHGLDSPAEAVQSLRSYRHADTIRARNICADLYLPPAEAAVPEKGDTISDATRKN